MAFGHGNQKPARHGRGRRRRGRGGREADGNNNAGEWTDAERDQMLRGLRDKLLPRVGTVANVAQWADAPKLTRQGVVNIVGRWAGENSRTFDEALMELSVRSRTLGGADTLIAFALQRGVVLDAPDNIQDGGSTGMARTKKQEEQRRAREEREAAGKGGSKGGGGAQEGAGKGGAAKGGAQAAGASKTPAGGPRRVSRPRPQELPDPEGKGFAQESIAEIDAATEAYVAFRDEHQELTKRLSEAKAHLMDRMKHHKKERYKWEGQIVVYTHEEAENVKVEKAKKTAADEPNQV